MGINTPSYSFCGIALLPSLFIIYSMKWFKLNPVTDQELSIWFKNKLVNPRTNRRIKEFSRTYNYLNDNYKLMIDRSESNDKKHITFFKEIIKKYQGPAQGDHLKSFDNKDPISQEDIWENSPKTNEKIVSDDIPSFKLFSYLDTQDKIRCFNIEQLAYPFKNPRQFTSFHSSISILQQ